MRTHAACIREAAEDGSRPATAAAPATRTRGLWPALILLLLLAAGFRVHLAWWKGHLGDLLCFQAWAVRDMEWTPFTREPPIRIPNHPPST